MTMRFLLSVSLATLSMIPAAAALAADAGHGEKVFKRCAVCHTLEAGGKHRQGPNLHGMFGRKAGSAEGYDKYSDAMKTADVVWTEETLDEFLASPKKFIAGNTMSFSALRKEKDRSDVIAYLIVATK